MAKSRKILLIDYDPESIESTRGPLVKAGYEVEVASDGIAGIEAFERLQPDLVLIEPMVPKKHGFQVCQEIKSTSAGRDTPVLITTGFYRGRKHRDEAHESYGCDDYLEKPIAEELLLSTCSKFLIDTDEPPIPVTDEPGASVSLEIPSAEIPSATPGRGFVDSLPDLPIPGQKETPTLQALDDLTEDEIQERLDAMIIGPEPPPEKPPSDEIVPVSIVTPTPVPEPPPAPPEVESSTAQRSDATVKSLLSRQPAPAAEPDVTSHAAVESSARSRLPLWIGIAAALFIVVGISILWILRDKGDADPSIETASISIGQVTPKPSPVPTNLVPLRLPSVPVPDVVASDTPAEQPMETPATASALVREAANVPEPRATIPPGATQPPPSSSTGHGAEVAREEKVDAPPEPAAAATAALLTAEVPSEVEDMTEIAISEPEPDPESTVAVDSAEAAEASSGMEVTPAPPVAPPAPKTRRGELVDLAELDRPPVVTDKPMPEYPASALSMRVEGTVNLRLLVDEHGRVEQVEIESGTKSKQLQRAATRAAENWVYEPGVKDGVPVKVWVPAAVHFKL